MNKVFLVCKSYSDGDGNQVEEHLEIFSSLESAHNFCVNHFLEERGIYLFNDDGSKKLIKNTINITDGVENFHYIEQPKIYYDDYFLCLDDREEFIKKYIGGDIFEEYGKKYYIFEMEVKG